MRMATARGSIMHPTKHTAAPSSTVPDALPCLIKCCGMFRHEDIVAVNAAHPDMVGFVVNVPSSHRSVSLDALSRLANSVDPSIVRVGVFVDEKPETIVHVVAHASIDVVQLHGHEDEAYVLDLRTRLSATGCQIRESVKRVMPHRPRTTPIICAFRIRCAADLDRARASSADLILLDNGQGSGARFDWSLISHVGRPFMLAGGLTPDNVFEAIRDVQPWAVDMSSGLETNHLKDPHKIRAAVAAVRMAAATMGADTITSEERNESIT